MTTEELARRIRIHALRVTHEEIARKYVELLDA